MSMPYPFIKKKITRKVKTEKESSWYFYLDHGKEMTLI